MKFGLNLFRNSVSAALRLQVQGVMSQSVAGKNDAFFTAYSLLTSF